MGVNVAEFESFEQQILEFIGEFRSLTTSEVRIRDALRAESLRAEAAEASRASAERAACEARAGAAAATAAAAHAATALAGIHDEKNAIMMQLELTEHQRKLLEERCSEMSGQLSTLERELQELRIMQTVHSNVQRQYIELQERVRVVTENARSEASRLEGELRRVERCAAGGAEIRERARLAAAAHTRERRLAATELQHTTHELLAANTQITRLGTFVAELQRRLTECGINNASKTNNSVAHDAEVLAEMRAALEAERAGTVRLERALAAALADNETLTAQMNSNDNTTYKPPTSIPPVCTVSNNVCPIDSFLAE